MHRSINLSSTGSYAVEYTIEGIVSRVGQGFVDLYGLNKEEVIGNSHEMLWNMLLSGVTDNRSLWSELKDGVRKNLTHYINVGSSELKVSESYIPVNENDKITKVICFGKLTQVS